MGSNALAVLCAIRMHQSKCLWLSRTAAGSVTFSSIQGGAILYVWSVNFLHVHCRMCAPTQPEAEAHAPTLPCADTGMANPAWLLSACFEEGCLG